MAYDRYDPIGNERFDYLFARLAYYVMVAINPEAAKEIKLEDLMPKFGPVTSEPAEVDPNVFLAKVRAMNMRMGGAVKKK